MGSVNFNVKTQAHAYQEGMRDGMALLVTALEESGSINHLLEVLEWNARPEDVTRLNDYYADRTSTLDAIPDAGAR